MINYPPDRPIAEQAKAHGLPEPVLVRDLVRVVEVLNLSKQGFFSRESVLAGSMALRCFGSPRFTVYDADFSTSSQTVDPPTAMKAMLNYRDDDLEITASDLVPHDEGGTAWKSAPITFEPIFTSLVPNPDDRAFKADVSFRGLLLPGLEVPLLVPYDLHIWADEPAVYVMDPHETVAEKFLGWCAHRSVKYYVDLGYIALVSQPKAKTRLIELNFAKTREITAAKLETMSRLQPDVYARFSSVDGLVGELSKPRSTVRPRAWGRGRGGGVRMGQFERSLFGCGDSSCTEHRAAGTRPAFGAAASGASGARCCVVLLSGSGGGGERSDAGERFDEVLLPGPAGG